MASLFAGCAASDPEPPRSDLEKRSITVGALPLDVAAPLHIAKARRYFADAGLNVEVKSIQSTGLAFADLVGGSLDVIMGNYVAVLAGQGKAGDFRIIGDLWQGKKGTCGIVTAPTSPINQPADLGGKKAAIAAKGSIAHLATIVPAKIQGVDPAAITYVERGIPETPQAIASGQVDVGWLCEPVLTAATAGQGFKKISDTFADGPMRDLPVVGWAATASWVKRNPKTLAAFQRAMARAQQIAASNPQAVRDILPTYTKIPPQVAAQITLGTYPLTLDKTRVQRVADLMLDVGFLKRPVDVGPLLVQPPTS